MKVTKMRIKGSIPAHNQLVQIMNELFKRFEKAGFITNIPITSTTGLKIGLHMRTFSLDLEKHDRNLQSGIRLTDLPTWYQRVEFNNIINSVLNKFKVSCNVKSGPFIIRQGLTAMTENDWYSQKPDWIVHNEARGYIIESIDEKEYINNRRISRNKQARLNRLQLKQLASAPLTPFICVVPSLKLA